MTLESVFYTPKELAEFLNISTRTLSRWHKKGIGPRRFKCGNLIGYKYFSVREWLTRNEHMCEHSKSEASE